MREIAFQKYQGCGNDFIYIAEDLMKEAIRVGDAEELIRSICHRQFGIGADGVIFAEQTEGTYKMHYYNKDGSQANMCGNGMRTFRIYLVDNFGVKDKVMRILTAESEVEVALVTREIVSLSLGVKAEVQERKIEGTEYYQLYTMTDHLVHLVDQIPADWLKRGEELSHHTYFPQGTNVNFVAELSPGHVRVETWERGVGRTLSCGTGAVASAIAYQKYRYPSTSVVFVETAGGALEVDLQADEAYLVGGAKRVGQGVYYFEDQIQGYEPMK